MAWDQNAKLLAFKTLATIESNMKWDCVYYGDAITIGIIQHYAGKAARLCLLMKDIPEYQQVAASVRADVAARGGLDHNTNWDWWTGRFLTNAEGRSFSPVLTCDAGKKVQMNEVWATFSTYEAKYRSLGGDPNTNTQQFILWCCGYHQGPAHAVRCLNTAGAGASMERLLSVFLGHRVLGKYPSRYQKAIAIIKAGDISGLEGITSGDDITEGDDGAYPSIEGNSVSFIQQSGQHLVLTLNGGKTVMAYFDGKASWVPENNNAANIAKQGDGSPLPGPIDPSQVGEVRAKLCNWFTSREKTLNYSQTHPHRLTPDRSKIGDCSSTAYAAYKEVLGINIGYNTKMQYIDNDIKKVVYSGPPSSNMLSGAKPGDLIYFGWRNGSGTVDHVEMYLGGDDCIGHGGGRHPIGPVRKKVSQQATVARYIKVLNFVGD